MKGRTAARKPPTQSNSRKHVATLACLLIFAFVACGPGFAQDGTTAISNAAIRMAPLLRHDRARRILVFDFTGPGGVLSDLGVQLADDFAAALSRSAPKLNVANRSKIRRRMDKAGYTPEALVFPNLTLQMARDLEADTAVSGTVSREGDQVKISISATAVRSAKLLDTEQLTVPVTAETTRSMKVLVAKSDAAPESGKNGYSYPRCLSCPQAPYTSSAVNAKVDNATVILSALITPDGRANNVIVIKTVPYGLTESAVGTVQRWR